LKVNWAEQRSWKSSLRIDAVPLFRYSIRKKEDFRHERGGKLQFLMKLFFSRQDWNQAVGIFSNHTTSFAWNSRLKAAIVFSSCRNTSCKGFPWSQALQQVQGSISLTFYTQVFLSSFYLVTFWLRNFLVPKYRQKSVR